MTRLDAAHKKLTNAQARLERIQDKPIANLTLQELLIAMKALESATQSVEVAKHFVKRAQEAR